jgi:PKD repeat protein
MAPSTFGRVRLFCVIPALFVALVSLQACVADAPQKESDLSVETVTATPRSGPAPLEVSFSVLAETSTEPVYVQWTFGDGASGSGTEVTHTYTEIGEYTAEAIISDAQGGSETEQITISVVPPDAPVATATATPDSGIAPLSVSFGTQVTGGSGDYSFAWDFGDGSTREGKTPSHRYEEAGTFSAVVTVTDVESGVESEPATVEIRIADNDTPIASAGASPSSGIVPLTVAFNGSVVGGNEPFTYEWDFGDGSTPAETQNPSHEYTSPGTFSAVFKVTDADGEAATETIQIQVADNTAPIAEIAATPESGIAPLSVQFDPQVQGGDAPLDFAWDFGDGETSESRRPSHTFQSAGDYTTSVTVTDQNGDVATDTITVTVTDNTVPSVGPTATPESGLAPLQVQFSSNASGGDGALTYAWNFGDGNSSTTENPVHTYQSSGEFTASVTVTDQNGDATSGTVDISVGSDLVPNASVSATPRDGYAPLQVQFFGSASGGNAPLSYQWNFGNGDTSTDQNPTYTYQTSGSYTATLVVTDANGDSDSAPLSIEVIDNLVPQVSVSASPTSGIVPFNVDFNASVTNGDAPLTYDWNFGDGTPTSTAVNPSHSYTAGGSYTATLTVTDANGDTATDTVAIQAASNSQPAVSASSDTDTGTAPLTVNLSATATGGNTPLTYTWYFGDGSSPQSGQNATHTYNNIGVYDAEVVVTDADGDTATDTVQINALDHAPDLRVQSFTATVIGSEVEYEVVIENQGTADATSSFWVDFFDDESVAPTDATPYDATEYITDTITVGSTYTVTTTRTNLALGGYDAWALVDPEELNPDLDRTNNIGGPQSFSIESLLINEFMYATAGADTGTFIELYGTPGMDISGYSLEGVNGANGSTYDTLVFGQGTTIPQDGYLVIGDGTVANEDVTDSFVDLQNGPDNVVLKDASGTVLDAVGYGDFSADPGNFVGEGTAVANTPDDYSLGRRAEVTDTDDNSADFFLWREPTPGAANALALTNDADTCADAYELSGGASGRFLIEADLGGLSNDFTTMTSGGSGTCSATGTSFGGPDQVFTFTVPGGMTADVNLELDDNANVDLDSVLTASPCSSLDTGFVGCNIGFTESFTGLAAGTYYLVIMEDASSSSAGVSEPYEYIVDIELN